MQEENLRNKKLLGKHNKSYANPVYLDGFNPEEYIVIDIRHPYDFKEGHLQGSINITDLRTIATIAQNNKDKKVLLQCYSGHTASVYGSELVNAGFDNIYYLDENIADFEDHGILLQS
ncbi:rhodanese-like domain-containing protein [Helicobacter cappadocius]|uniref:Rhodanese-like domain-containing protein n=1 Tax=Helicobacter cappadocius TaxID=3063998 RepID=A0AA90PRZ2_9HELI|nr:MULTISPECIES: rhodanese-like domain-containing protein [unclassified Helicobacter]MDO7252988.1 rhodanese-like domain-containing protein [Helicobacter sp. faydin-H75]MDP2539022.1 rhodanese-like domain-containing protein [Helicobacter sp. faydin-H76]